MRSVPSHGPSSYLYQVSSQPSPLTSPQKYKKAISRSLGGSASSSASAAAIRPKSLPKVQPPPPKFCEPLLTPAAFDATHRSREIVVQLYTAGWKNLHLLKDVPLDAAPAPHWQHCPGEAEMASHLKRLVCRQALKASVVIGSRYR